MLKEKTHLFCNEISENTHPSHVKIYKTSAGPLFLRNCCSPSFVESLKADEGLHAFAHLPEREHQMLLSIAQQPVNRLISSRRAYNCCVISGRLSRRSTLSSSCKDWKRCHCVWSGTARMPSASRSSCKATLPSIG